MSRTPIRSSFEVYDEFLCPISQEVMECPVIACKEGHVFEKSAIEEWIKTRKTCPVCRCAIDQKEFKVNRYLKGEIERWTMITSDEKKRAAFEPVLEVEESDKAIRQVLMNYSIQPSGRMKENRRLLKQLSEELQRKLVYIAPL